MLIEIPDFEIILSVVTAFVVGVFSFFAYQKIKPLIEIKTKPMDRAYLERLEFYEKQLIDMKIRLDSLEIDNLDIKSTEKKEKEENIKNLTNKIEENKEIKTVNAPKNENKYSFGHGDVVDHVLRLITEKQMTSRDIQITIGRTREHTSRLLKKLFEDGYVQRNTLNKPYTYFITEKGKARIGLLKEVPSST